MPRRRRGTRISDSAARKVASRMCFAAAAEGLGGLYGSTSLERALSFSPCARAKRRALHSAPPGSAANWPKCPWPTGACKKWLHGHVVNDQTLSLIAETHPKVAERMRQARDSDLVKALTIFPVDHCFVGTRICALSPELFGNYLGCAALGHFNPTFASRLCADLLGRALNGAGLEVLVATVGLSRTLTTVRGLDDAFAVALMNAAKAHPEIAFAKDALVDAWSQREPNRGVEQAPVRVVPVAMRKCS